MFNPDSFLKKFEGPQKKNFVQRKSVSKVYLNAPVNYGRYQVLPFNSAIEDFPFINLPYTKEVYIPRKIEKNDGTSTVFSSWIKILPSSAYKVKDETGRTVSSLTAADEKLLRQAGQVFDELFEEVDAKNNFGDKVISELVRRKNYTIFHAHCVNYWKIGNSRQPERQNFNALFVLTSRKFAMSLKEDIEQFAIVNNVGEDWLDSVYNNKLTDRDGMLMFSVNRDNNAPGFVFSTQHIVGRSEFLKDVKIDPEEAVLMQDPVETFLGWQANREDESVPVGKRHLFNAKLINEAIDFMTKQLESVRLAKQNNTSIEDAITKTNQEATTGNFNSSTDTVGQTTNDPMLASMNNEAAKAKMNINTATDTQKVVNNNTQPFTSPAAAHFDPMGNVAGPSFANGGSNDDLPF